MTHVRLVACFGSPDANTSLLLFSQASQMPNFSYDFKNIYILVFYVFSLQIFSPNKIPLKRIDGIDPSQRLTPLSYFVRQAIVLLYHTSCSHTVKKHCEAKRKLTICRQRQNRAGYFWCETWSQLLNFVIFVRNSNK